MILRGLCLHSPHFLRTISSYEVTRMNIAFAGFGHAHIFALYREALAHKKVTVLGAFEESAEARAQISYERKIEFNYASYEEMLNDSRVDVIAIGDIFAKRGKLIIKALKHGKHVICDKPLCTSLEELDEIKRLANASGLKVHCMLELRFMPQAEKVRELIHSGEIGEIKSANFTAQHHLAYGTRPDWYFKDGAHGGTINDIAIHGIDLLRFLTGKELTKIHAARTWNAFADKEPHFKDSAQFMAEMDGMALMADVSYAAPKCPLPTYWDVYLWGTDGMINFRCADNEIRIYKNEKTTITCEATPSRFIDCLIDEISGGAPIINTADSLESAKQALMLQAFANEVG